VRLDFVERMGNGDWWIVLAMDLRTSPWMWWQWRFGCESWFLIWCIEIKVMLLCYAHLWLASERKLVKSLQPNQKGVIENQEKMARHSATKEATPDTSGWFRKFLK
jgi:hypothetical protein